MAARKHSRGICGYCGNEYSKGGMTRHLRACPERKQAIEMAEQGAGRSETLYHLRAEDRWNNDFWLDLEMRGSEPLGELDHYLRAIWLECCGHLSLFAVGGWSGEEIPVERPVNRVFKPDLELTHIYDFGSSSYTFVRMVETRQGSPTSKHPITLMARNLLPEATCMKCEQQAGWLCMECVYEDDLSGFLCDKHVKRHPHDAYGAPMPLVNSPRLGICGYEGPAEPPY